MLTMPKDYENIQFQFTSSSRGTRMGRRVARNVAEFAPLLNPPIAMIGCGDGFEVECMLKHFNIPIEQNAVSKQIIGLEVTKNRVEIAQASHLPVYEGSAENILDFVGDIKYNIYCAHTLEHCFNKQATIESFKKIALDTIVIIVPIELRGRTRNRAHYSPISNLGSIANQFGMDWKITMTYRFNIELEGVVILKRDPMNWPVKYKGSRNPELLIKGQF